MPRIFKESQRKVDASEEKFGCRDIFKYSFITDLLYVYIYILTNKINTTFYIGITNNIERRIYEHKFKQNEGFSSKYNLTKLVYYEECSSSENAINREKQLKRWHREWKINLIKEKNPLLLVNFLAYHIQ